jgi:hypothetical protein
LCIIKVVPGRECVFVKKKMKEEITIKTSNGFRPFTGERLSSHFVWADNVEEDILPCACETKLVPTEFFEEDWKLDGFDEVVHLEKYITYERDVTYVAKEDSDAVLTR